MGLHLVTGYAGQEHVTSADQGSYNAATMGEGQFVLERGNQFEAQIISNNKVRVLDGDLMMQGRHIRLKENTYEELDFENGTQNEKRNDLIVVRYTKDATTGIEGTELLVVKGTPTTGTPADPELVVGDILHENALMNEFALYRVPFDGLVIQDLVCLFDTVPTWETLKDEVRAETQNAISDMRENVVDDYDDAIAVTESNVLLGCKAFQGLKKIVDTISSSINAIKNSYVVGVKGDTETSYRTGKVNITKANIGLGNAENTKDADKSVKYAATAGTATHATDNMLMPLSEFNCIPLDLSEPYEYKFIPAIGGTDNTSPLATNRYYTFLVVKIGIQSGASTYQNVIIPFPWNNALGTAREGFSLCRENGNHFRGYIDWVPSKGTLKVVLESASTEWKDYVALLNVWKFGF